MEIRFSDGGGHREGREIMTTLFDTLSLQEDISSLKHLTDKRISEYRA